MKDLNSLNPDLRNKLYKFQLQSVEFGLKNLGRILLADEMGVGKTV